MNEEDITTVTELAEFMTAEAALYGREDSEQATANGKGIMQQWEARDQDPYMIFYLLGREATEDETANNPFPRADGAPTVIFEMKSMWFTDDGNVTDRPCGNEAPLYRNE